VDGVHLTRKTRGSTKQRQKNAKQLSCHERGKVGGLEGFVQSHQKGINGKGGKREGEAFGRKMSGGGEKRK